MAPMVEALGGHGVDKGGEATAGPKEEVGGDGAEGNEEGLATLEGGRMAIGITDVGGAPGGTWEEGICGLRRCQGERRGALELEETRNNGRWCTGTDGGNEGHVLATPKWT